MKPKDSDITRDLADGLGISVDAGELDRLVADYGSVLTEWSVNEELDGRGRLRTTLWTEDLAAAARVGASCLPEPWARLDAILPPVGMAGLGLAFSTAGARKRWYRLAPVGDGTGLSYAAARLFPDLERPTAELAAICGGRANCTALGLDLGGAGLVRATIYFRVGHPAQLHDLFQAHHFPDHPRTTLFLARVLGLDPQAPRPWPKVWVAHSVGAHGGVKLYYFARKDPDRPADTALLDTVAAPPVFREVRRRLASALSPRPEAAPVDVVQLLALRLDSPAPPSWTLYLADR